MSEAGGSAGAGAGSAGGGTGAGGEGGAGAGSAGGEGSGTGGSAGGGAGAGSTSWMDSLAPDVKEYVSTKGFKDPASVLDSYRNLEKLHGVPKERLLKLPEKADAPEWKDVYSKLGVPENKDGYGLQSQEGGDPKFVEWAKDTFHGLNLTKDQAVKLVEKFGEFAQGKDTTSKEQYKTQVDAQELNLKKEWGQAFDQNISNAQRAVQKFGVPKEAIDSLEKTMGFDGVMKFFNNIGSRIGEGNFVPSNAQNGSGFGNQLLTPEQAKSQIEALKKDPDFSAKYVKGDVEARQRMTNLHQMANPS